ncbi:hypothetical protein PYW08_015683 [Mythimna loreyi]|uniref:Uncharacterized protein n=1 Tax=Mythimna loreyi TaxID=667449 RepID=A0ACC2QTZ7_9NEOP|nr:hypothetical protein PYW08_015683 [Mythimna loreyi]
MANPNFRQDGDKNVLNIVVLWCCCLFFFVICGYGLYRHHTLEQRVIVLEKQFEEFRREAAKAEEPVLSTAPELSRKERDVGDCICPPAALPELLAIYWKDLRDTLTNEMSTQDGRAYKFVCQLKSNEPVAQSLVGLRTAYKDFT